MLDDNTNFDIDVDYLAKLLGMLGSSHESEVVNAAAAATKLLRQHGLSWAELANGIRQKPKPLTNEAGRYAFEDHMDAAEKCLESGVSLSDWEINFLESMPRYASLFEKQEYWMAFLCKKCGVQWQ
jgi:hypothetical protein